MIWLWYLSTKHKKKLDKVLSKTAQAGPNIKKKDWKFYTSNKNKKTKKDFNTYTNQDYIGEKSIVEGYQELQRFFHDK